MIEVLKRKKPLAPAIGIAKNTPSYKWVLLILWLQIGVVKDGS